MRDLYHEDLFSRSRAVKLVEKIKENPEQNAITIDFQGINFISRSFADEIWNIVDDNKNKKITFVGMSEDVNIMISKVKKSRSQERKRVFSNPKMYSFDTMEELSAFLLSM